MHVRWIKRHLCVISRGSPKRLRLVANDAAKTKTEALVTTGGLSALPTYIHRTWWLSWAVFGTPAMSNVDGGEASR